MGWELGGNLCIEGKLTCAGVCDLQLFQVGESKPLQETLGRSKSLTPILAGEVYDQAKIAQLDHQPAFVGGEELVDFGLADWLFESDAGEDFERGRGEIGIAARAGLRAEIFGETTALDLRRQ